MQKQLNEMKMITDMLNMLAVRHDDLCKRFDAREEARAAAKEQRRQKRNAHATGWPSRS